MAYRILFNQKKLQQSVGKLAEKLRDEVVRETTKEIKRNLSKRSGTPSPPGQPPAKQTGKLLSSVKVKKTKRGKGKARGEIVVASPYAKALEFGTTKMAPRPYLRPAKAKVLKRLLKIVKKVRKGIKFRGK